MKGIKMQKHAFAQAFTLAEIMIVLTVVGVLTAILLPAAFHATPDENVMKFKKANSTLGTVIRELVNSDKYYADGDLGKMPDGSLVDSATYFCETFSDVASVKSKNCQPYGVWDGSFFQIFPETDWEEWGKYEEWLDKACDADSAEKGIVKNEIVTTDNIKFYETSSKIHFGSVEEDTGKRIFKDFSINSFDNTYKIICIDVDEINSGEAPFGYGIRSDGKIQPGPRALEWIEKSVQNKE